MAGKIWKSTESVNKSLRFAPAFQKAGTGRTDQAQRVIDISSFTQWHTSVRIRGARVFERLNPKQFEYCFEQWVNQLVRCVRHSGDRH